MTQRSILAGLNPNVIVKVGASVTVTGQESDMVVAEAKDHRGLQVERRSASQIARARAALGDRVLFDVRLKIPPQPDNSAPAEVIEVQIGGSGEVRVPFGSNVKVYAAKDIDVQGVRGQVDAFAGQKLNLQGVSCLGNASAGRAMNLDCDTMREASAEFQAGDDLRFYVHDLISARIRVKDIGGYWEARIGGGERSVYLKCGGDAVLVTDQKVEALPPSYIMGKIERPATT